MRHYLRSTIFAVLLAATLAGCGGGSSSLPVARPATVKLPPSVVKACPDATHGKGGMGECAPPTKAPEGAPTKARASSTRSGGITYSDRSNNDPTYNMAAIKRAGHPAIVLKVNQGVGFLDQTFYYATKAAQRVGLAIGGYDFDQEYTASEVYTFIGRLRAAGIYRSTPNTLPPTLDVEYGNASRAGLEHQIAVLQRTYGRVNIYTASWFFLPHFGCWIPKGVTFWLAGYPTAPLLCGLSEWLFTQHQYTDHGYDGAGFADMSVWRGSAEGFRSFIHAPKPGPTAAQVRALRKQEALRRELHADLEHHHCRKGQHATPREPLSVRTHVHDVLCPSWTLRGAHAVALINRYHQEGVR